MRSWSVAEPFEFRVFVQLFATLLPLGISTYVERYLWLVAPFFAVIAAGLIGLWSRRGLDHGPLRSRQKQSVSLLLLFLVVPLLVVYVLTRPRGLFYAPNVEARYLVLFAPAFYLLLAWAVLAVQRRSASIGGLVCVFVAIVFLSVLPGHYGGRYLRDELQTMARVVGTYAESGDAVVVVSGSRYPIFDYYWGRLSQMHVSPPVYFVPQQSLMVDDSNVAAELEPVAADHARIWLAEVNAPMEDPRGLVKSWLGERYAPALSYGFAHNALTLYAPAGELATVNAGNLAPQHEAAVELGGDTVLRGYDLPTSEFRPGDVVRLALYYSSLQGAELSIRLVDELGRVLAERRCHWPAVQPVGREQLDFTIFPNTPAGTYHLELGPEGAEPDAVPCFIHIRGTRTLPEVDEPIAAYAATLEGGIHLSGYSITDASGQAVRGIHPGQILTLDLFWYNEEKLSRDYTVFAHLVGQAYNPATAGPVWAGHDSQPADNGYPTTQWFVGETIVDRHVLTIDAGAPSGEYEVEVGMYLLETMQRLHFLDDQGGMVADRAVLDRFELVRSE
jgi:hypothetical protein